MIVPTDSQQDIQTNGDALLGGEPYKSFTISVTPNVSLSCQNCEYSSSMNMGLIISGSSGALDSAGVGTAGISGVLVVAANQEGGVYQGEYTVTADYQ